MGPDQLGVFWLIISSVALLATLFGMRYLRNKENMALIEKGINPNVNDNRPAPYRTLKNGLLFVGAGIGLFIAYVLDVYVFPENDKNTFLYFSLVAICGGIGLISSYRVEKRDLLNKEGNIYKEATV
jgi:hypothetical protein